MHRWQRRRTGTAVSLAVLGSCVPAVARAQVERPLQHLLEAEIARMPAQVGVYVKHLRSGREVAIRADEPFGSQSTRKLAMMIMAFQMAEAGKLDLDERIRVGRDAYHTGSGVLQYHDPGALLTVRDLVTEMIITSDNAATALVIRELGGIGAINTWLRANGYEHTMTTDGTIEAVRYRYATLGGEYAELSDEELLGLERLRTRSPLYRHYADLFVGDRKPLADRVVREAGALGAVAIPPSPITGVPGTGRTSAREMGRLLEVIETGTATSAEGSSAMRDMLLRQQLGARRIPHYLQGIQVGHKTGDSGTAANDVGIIYGPSGPIIVAFLVNDITERYGEVEDQIGIMSRMIVDYFK